MGPASTGTDNTWYQIDQNQSIYYSGNLKDTNLNGTLNGAATTPYWYQGTGTVLTSPWSSETTATPALIIGQVMTLGNGTTGSGANTVGPNGGLYTTQTDTGLANNGSKLGPSIGGLRSRRRLGARAASNQDPAECPEYEGVHGARLLWL